MFLKLSSVRNCYWIELTEFEFDFGDNFLILEQFSEWELSSVLKGSLEELFDKTSFFFTMLSRIYWNFYSFLF